LKKNQQQTTKIQFNSIKFNTFVRSQKIIFFKNFVYKKFNLCKICDFIYFTISQVINSFELI